MSNPRKLAWGERSGIDVEYVRSRRILYLGGWYDSFVGIQSVEISLTEFLTGLGITLRDCERALREAQSTTASRSLGPQLTNAEPDA